MPNTHTTLTSLFDDIADEIRVKLPTGDSEKSSEIVADTFDTAISRILTPADGSIPSKGSETFNTSSSDRTISAGQYLSGNQTIKAVETSGISAGNIKDGVTVKVGDANDDDRIAGVTGTFSKSSTITGSGKSAASAGNILTGKAAFLDGAQLNGTMPNNGATGTTITTQGGTYTIPAGYTSGGTVTASIAASILDDSIISGEAVIEATDDYAWRTTVNIPAGFYNAQTLIKDFGSIFPAPSTEGTSSDMLAGYELFDHAGRKITGTMPNNSTTGGVITTQGGTYSIPAGYTSGGTVTASINNAVITSGTGSATISDPSYNSSTGKFTQSASGTVAAPSVGTAGYISSVAGTKNPSTLSGSKTLNKVGTGVDITGTTTKQPSIARGTPASGDGWTDAASGSATTSKPSSGVYVKVSSPANTGTLTATPKVTSEGYGTIANGQYSSTASTATVGASASADTYVPITGGTAGTPIATKGTVSSHQVTVTPSVTNVTGWITGSTKTGSAVTVKASDLVSGNLPLNSGTSSQTDIDVTNYATVSISAIGGGSHSGSVSTHSFTNPTVTPSIGGTSTNISSTTKPSGTDGTDYWTLDPGGSVTTNGSSVAKAKAIIDTAGYISTDSGESAASTITINSDRVSIAAGTNRYISKATSSSTQPTASATNGTASIVNQPSASASTSVTGMVTTSTNTGYIVSASASANSGNSTATGGSASTTAGSVTVGAGYNPSAVTVSVAAKSASGTSATSTAVSDSSSSTKYIQKGILGAGVSVSGGSASIAATGFTGSSSATNHYVTLSTSAGSATGSASVSTEGYVKNETASSGAKSVSVSGNGNKIYIPNGNVATSASLDWDGNQVTITPYSENSAGYIESGTDFGSDITITASNLVSGNRALSSAVGNQTGIDVTNYATVSISGIGSGVLSTSDSSISGNSFTPSLGYNSSTGKFDYSGSANATGTAYAKASTAGYVSSSNNVSKSLSATVSATGSVNKVGTGVDITGATTKQPSISRGTPASGDGWTDASSGASTTTKPSSGVYVKVYSSANTGTLTATPKVTSNGYGTTSYYGSSAGTATVGASASADTYVPITGGTAGTPTASKGTVSSHQISVTPSVTNTTGWITGGTKSGTAVTVTAAELVSGNKALSSSASAQTNIDVTNYATVSISAIGSGTAGTPTASKGTVSSNQVTVTPSVTNTTGYITGGTITGTGVVVKASELVSGNKSLSSGTSNQTGIDVTNYSTVSISAIASGTAGTPSASKGSVSNHSISVTPSVTNTTGYITGGTKTGTAVTVSASELVSGNLALSSSTSAQTGIDVTNYSTVSIAAYVLDIATLAQTKAAVGLS